MNLLSLQLRQWYALDYYFADQPGRHASPIWVKGLTPGHTGKGELYLQFHHANYPEGAQQKDYQLKVLRRTSGFLLAERTDCPAPRPVLVITAITADWIRLHWPRVEPEDEIQAWCDDAFGRPGHPPRAR